MPLKRKGSVAFWACRYFYLRLRCSISERGLTAMYH